MKIQPFIRKAKNKNDSFLKNALFFGKNIICSCYSGINRKMALPSETNNSVSHPTLQAI